MESDVESAIALLPTRNKVHPSMIKQYMVELFSEKRVCDCSQPPPHTSYDREFRRNSLIMAQATTISHSLVYPSLYIYLTNPPHHTHTLILTYSITYSITIAIATPSSPIDQPTPHLSPPLHFQIPKIPKITERSEPPDPPKSSIFVHTGRKNAHPWEKKNRRVREKGRKREKRKREKERKRENIET